MDIPKSFIEGFLLCIGLTIVIGPQNLFVLKQGLIARHIFVTALTCTFCDFLLISLGSLGLGSLVVHTYWLRETTVWGGALFLVIYGLKSWIGVFRGRLAIHEQTQEYPPDDNRKKVILCALGFSILNPQAFVDAILVIGGISARFEGIYDRILFIAGAGIASACWFFGLSYGAALLRPLFQKKTTAMAFELLSGGLMLWISWGLIQTEYRLRNENNVVQGVIADRESDH